MSLNDTMSRLKIYNEITKERKRQNKKWGEQNHPIKYHDDDKWFVDMCNRQKRICDARASLGIVTWHDILMEEVFEAFAENSSSLQREEFTQVAAVTVQIIECIDRQNKKQRIAARKKIWRTAWTRVKKILNRRAGDTFGTETATYMSVPAGRVDTLAQSSASDST